MPAVVEPPDVALERRAVDAECIRQVCLQPAYYALAGPVGAALLVLALLHQVPGFRGLSWLAALVSTRAVVRVLGVRFGRNVFGASLVPQRLYLASEMVQGAVWGLGVFVLGAHEERYQVLVILVLLATAILACLSMAPYFVAAAAFTAPVAIFLTSWEVAQGGRWGYSLAAGTLLVYGMGLYHAWRAHCELRKAVAGRLEIVRLASQLELARARAESANAELQARNDRLREIARRDPLTGLFNRRHFVEWLDRVRLRDVATRPWFLAILDADHFKRFNDEFGHQVGDRVLTAIATSASDELRWTDCFARIGGEEFGLLLQDVTFADAVSIVERVRAAVAAVDLGVGKITLSVGLVVGEQSMDAAIALARADEALYEAKRTGRDKLVCDPPFPPAPRTAEDLLAELASQPQH